MGTRKPKLRIHLVGESLAEKIELAERLRVPFMKEFGRTLVISDMQEHVRNRLGEETSDYSRFGLALESEYLRYESGVTSKAKHLIFVDSIVDRYWRARLRYPEIELFFTSRLKSVDDGFLAVYGPVFDPVRTGIIRDYRLPVQIRTSGDLSEIIEAAKIRILPKSE